MSAFIAVFLSVSVSTSCHVLFLSYLCLYPFPGQCPENMFIPVSCYMNINNSMNIDVRVDMNVMYTNMNMNVYMYTIMFMNM